MVHWGDGMSVAAPWVQLTLVQAMDGHTICRSTITSYQSAVTSETVKHCWLQVNRATVLLASKRLFLTFMSSTVN